MADTTVNNAVEGVAHRKLARSQHFTSQSVGYQFFVGAADSDLYYTKTTDGGLNWGVPVKIRTGTVPGFDIWYDRWTPGITGTKFHICYVDSAAHDVFYRSLETATDTLGSEATVFDGASASTTEAYCSVAKARDGNLVCVYDIDGGTELGAKDSPDGSTWSAIADPLEATQDYWILFPGNALDQRDMMLAFWDRTANEISLKTYDDSGDSWSENAIVAATDTVLTSVGQGWSGSIRHSDGHLILGLADSRDGATSDLKVYDISINGGFSSTALTEVITDKDDWYNPHVFIDQQNTDLYVAYNGKSDGSETVGTSTLVYYKKSIDEGATWGTETAYSESAGDVLSVSGSLGGLGTRFAPAFWTNGAADLFVNVGASVQIAGPSGGSGGGAQGGGKGGGKGGGGGSPGGGGGNGGTPGGGGGGAPGKGPKQVFAIASGRRRARAGVL